MRCFKQWLNVVKKRFQITNQGDPVEFLAWLLNSLHLTLNGTKNSNSSIIYKAFQGKMKVYTRKIPPIDLVRRKSFRKNSFLRFTFCLE